MNYRLRSSAKSVLSLITCVMAMVLSHSSSANNLASNAASAKTIFVDVVALDQPWWFNRLGASQPNGKMFALKRDVVSTDTHGNCAAPALCPGHVALRADKRPRPIVLRVAVGQTLEIKFTNLLTSSGGVSTTSAGVHIAGLELDANGVATAFARGNPPQSGPGINNDATWVGKNANAYAAPKQQMNYRYIAKEEGTYMLYSAAGDWNGQLAAGLFGAVVVEPPNSEWYRSQVTNADMLLASTQTLPDGRPLINYNATFPHGNPRAGQPILKMTKPIGDGRDELIYTDLGAIVTGPGGGEFPFTEKGPDFYANPTYPERRQPFREFAVMYHEVFSTAQQAFPQFTKNHPLSSVLGAGSDSFAINYGAAGIGAEVLASRLGVGPMGGKQSVDLKFEEFFLSSWSNGDPAMVVNVPANAVMPFTAGGAAVPPPTDTPISSPVSPVPASLRATKAYYPDDPSNVYHSYMRDHVTMRLLHTGQGITHVHHLHAHQWLRSPNSDDSHYLDSQLIAPGSTYSLEMAFNGSGNLNETVGDSIFHCHFYPHFAGGMWALWRVHDVFEAGTRLDANGIPTPGWNRALPDAEITAGTPIPAIVPLPTLAMAPAPALVQLIDKGTRVEVSAKGQTASGEPIYDNPGYPYFVPGVSGHRAPHPPIDFAWEELNGKPKLDASGNKIYLDGGLPRHQVMDGTIVHELHTRWDFSKDFIAYDKMGAPIAGGLVAFALPEEGTAVEKAAMAAHSTRTRASVLPNGAPGNFILNGLPPVPGAPFANPGVNSNGNGLSLGNTRRYQAAAIQTDAVLTKQGWHYPQQRMLTLWQDVAPTLKGERAPQPLFFRANSNETVEFWHTNLVPDYYDLDDFQVRTPTDIIGQHIHLVKFDVLASDGAGNGWNYEDGTFSPDEVRGRIDAMNLQGGIFNFDAKTQFKGTIQTKLTAKSAPAVFGQAPLGQNWVGAQTTIQRWQADPIENNQGDDRTLRTVFTHDHFGPSTHQQVGLYGGLLVEPQGSRWFDPISGGLLYDKAQRSDGGPTSWQANIVTANSADSYREFALEFADFQLAYTAGSPSVRSVPTTPLFTTVFSPVPVVGPVTPAISTYFANNGVTLAANAKIIAKGSDLLIESEKVIGVPDNYLLKPAPAPAVAGTYQAVPQNSPVGWSSPQFAINPTGADPVNQSSGAPFPTLISTPGAPGAFSLNYRAEPIPARVWNPATGQVASTNHEGDLSFAYASIIRADKSLNVQPLPGTPIDINNPAGFKFPANIAPTMNGSGAPADYAKVQPTDPFTPILRAYAGDKVQVRTLVGAHHNPHFFSIDGVKWLYEPGSANTGFRNNQPMGISEHYEMLFQLPLATAATKMPFADHLYNASAGTDGITNGLWGFMRSYKQKVDHLVPLPNNLPPATPMVATIEPPPGAKVRSFTVVATTAKQALVGGTLVYNNRGQVIENRIKPVPGSANNIQNPNALIYFRAEDLTSPDAKGKLKPGVPIEPLILRAAAGEWIKLTLINAFKPSELPAVFKSNTEALAPYDNMPNGNVTMNTSQHVGLNPQVVGYDITRGNGLNVGFNSTVTVAPGQTAAPVYWYAGTLEFENGKLKETPVELGAINLNPSDPLLQHTQGMVGALIIEPEGATWKEDSNMRAAATVTYGKKTFRDFVMIAQDDLNLQTGTPGVEATHAINYGTEPMAYRFPTSSSLPPDFKAATSNWQVGNLDPQTPIYTAPPGSEVRFRMLHPASGSGADGETLTIDGHVFQEEPYSNDSRTIAYNPLSQWFGARGGHGARNRFEAVIASAGGEKKVKGDYLYRSLITFGGGDFVAGQWGIFRVQDGKGSQATILPVQADGSNLLKSATDVEEQAASKQVVVEESAIVKRFKNRNKTHKQRLADLPEAVK
ncbi:hypothetical protein ACO0LM_01170 [Undibacterium sp. Di26W]|uniref:hypothetical protein n=1 Tax=Undibacterium sp. Di26W TaxID=3413035 RepID=UPI003BF00624